MKIPPPCIQILVQFFCLLGIMSCQTRKPATETAPATNHGKPEPVSSSDMKSMENVKEKM